MFKYLANIFNVNIFLFQKQIEIYTHFGLTTHTHNHTHTQTCTHEYMYIRNNRNKKRENKYKRQISNYINKNGRLNKADTTIYTMLFFCVFVYGHNRRLRQRQRCLWGRGLKPHSNFSKTNNQDRNNECIATVLTNVFLNILYFFQFIFWFYLMEVCISKHSEQLINIKQPIATLLKHSFVINFYIFHIILFYI